MTRPDSSRQRPDREDMDALRQVRTHDHAVLVRAIQNWWGDSRTPQEAEQLSLLLPRLFVEFFRETSFVVERGDALAGFLIGLHPTSDPEEAYIHFVGVNPNLRRAGVARRLYATFFERALAAGRRHIRAITSPANSGSISFHRAMGFALEPSDYEIDGVPVHRDYDGPGQDRVCLRLTLSAPDSGPAGITRVAPPG
ncbi:GNAT family N-acetyltransferase [Pseudonocardia yunnanensis]|uniref:GNAT family N-acetyltransferase n=1 Tax=Pseudonocardia yunnanensis TaxID=58107 RepID=A0ABW4FDW9_9PSEU